MTDRYPAGITNSEDVIDSRDVIERIAELEELAESEPPDDFEADELVALKALAEEAGDGEVLIRDSYFEDYARELAEDIGAVGREATWPARCIDWEQAAAELQQDYTAIDFDGVTYWIR